MLFGNSIPEIDLDVLLKIQTEFSEYDLKGVLFNIDSYFGKDIILEDIKDLKILDGNIYFYFNGELYTCPNMHKNDLSLYSTLVKEQTQALLKGI